MSGPHPVPMMPLSGPHPLPMMPMLGPHPVPMMAMLGLHPVPMMSMHHSVVVPMSNMIPLNGMTPPINLGAHGIPPALQQLGYQQQHPQQAGPFGKKDSHVKRPRNAYILWSTPRRKEIAEQHPKIRFEEINKQLGAEWRELSKAEKLPFIEKATQLQIEYEDKYLGNRYRPKQKPKSNFKIQEYIMPHFPSMPYFLQSYLPFNAFETKKRQTALNPYRMPSPFLRYGFVPLASSAYPFEAAASGSQSANNQKHAFNYGEQIFPHRLVSQNRPDFPEHISSAEAVNSLHGQIHHQQPSGMQSGSSSLSPTHSSPSVMLPNQYVSTPNSSPPQQQSPPSSVSPDRKA